MGVLFDLAPGSSKFRQDSMASVSREQAHWAEQIVEEIKSWGELQDLILSARRRELAEQVADTMARRLEHPKRKRDQLGTRSRKRRGCKYPLSHQRNQFPDHRILGQRRWRRYSEQILGNLQPQQELARCTGAGGRGPH